MLAAHATVINREPLSRAGDEMPRISRNASKDRKLRTIAERRRGQNLCVFQGFRGRSRLSTARL
jgi:hypothetical protein